MDSLLGYGQTSSGFVLYLVSCFVFCEQVCLGWSWVTDYFTTYVVTLTGLCAILTVCIPCIHLTFLQRLFPPTHLSFQLCLSLKSQLLWSVSDFTVKAFPVLLFSTVSVNKGYINSNIVLLSLVFWSTFWLNLIQPLIMVVTHCT